MKDYKKGKIYKIISDQTTDVYFGSTVQTLCYRITGHRRAYKRYNEGIFCYITSFEIVKYPDAKIILVENYPCNSKEELLIREQFYLDNNQCINNKRAYLTEEQRNEYYKEYHQDNKEQRKEYHKQHYQDNKEHKKQYRQDNKEHTEQIRRQPWLCEICEYSLRKGGKERHLKSYKHIINFINY